MTFGAIAALSTFAQINPVWLYGPYTPLAISSASQPDWYMGILEGSLRIMPAWEINFLGHTLSLSVAIPFIVPLTVILGGATFWPFFERLRREDPIHYTAESEFGPYWSVTRFDDIMTVESNHQVFSSKWELGGVRLEDQVQGYERPSFIQMDEPDHGQRRMAVSPVVAPANPCSAKIHSAASRSARSFSSRMVGLGLRRAIGFPECRVSPASPAGVV